MTYNSVDVIIYSYLKTDRSTLNSKSTQILSYATQAISSPKFVFTFVFFLTNLHPIMDDIEWTYWMIKKILWLNHESTSYSF